MIDMKIMEWTRIENSGIINGLHYHSLTRVSLSQLFLVGGDQGIDTKGVSNQASIFDVDKSEWKELPSLSHEFGGKRGGLKQHQAFTLKRIDDGVSVVCIGGFVDENFQRHPDRYAIFDFAA